jgi:hypothetical protein
MPHYSPNPHEDIEILDIPPPCIDSLDPWAHPSLGWRLNSSPCGLTFNIKVLNEIGELVTVPFYQVDLSALEPEILVICGCNCAIHTRPLHACADPYPRPMLTKKQALMFHEGQVYTPLVD